MNKNQFLFIVSVLAIFLAGCQSSLEKQFKNPPREYGPMPFWHINGELTTEGIRQQVIDANEAGFTGITLLPLATWKNKVGTSPEFLSDEYFVNRAYSWRITLVFGWVYLLLLGLKKFVILCRRYD